MEPNMLRVFSTPEEYQQAMLEYEYHRKQKKEIQDLLLKAEHNENRLERLKKRLAGIEAKLSQLEAMNKFSDN